MAGDADVIVVGGGLAGLVAATEIADAGKRVILLDQEVSLPPSRPACMQAEMGRLDHQQNPRTVA